MADEAKSQIKSPSMIHRVEIRNFKSFKDVTLELGRNNVLVGPNMAGKSNFLDVFRFIQDMLVPAQGSAWGTNNALNNRNGFANVAWRGANEQIIHLSLEGTSLWEERLVDWKYTIDLLGNFQWSSAQIHSEQLVLRDGGDEHCLVATENNQRNVFGWDGKQISQVSESTRLALEYEYPNWPGAVLKRSILSWRFYNLLPPLMRKPNPTTGITALDVYGTNLSAWLMMLQTRYSESFERLRSAALDVFPSLDNVFTAPTQQTTVYLGSNEKFLKRPTTVAEMSDGELVFLALLSLLYSPSELGGDVYFIEEPENHLHPRLLSVLAELLRQVQAELPKERLGQILITTHSPFLIDKFSIDELIVLGRKEGASTFIRPGDHKELRDLVNNEEIGLGDLYYSGALSLA